MPMYGTQRRFFRLEKFLINALHIEDDQSERERTLDYISGVDTYGMRAILSRTDIFQAGEYMVLFHFTIEF